MGNRKLSLSVDVTLKLDRKLTLRNSKLTLRIEWAIMGTGVNGVYVNCQELLIYSKQAGYKNVIPCSSVDFWADIVIRV